MATNDIYLITLKGGNEYSKTENTFTYKNASTGTSGIASGLGESFRTILVPLIRGILAQEWSCLEYTIKNLFNDADFEQYAFTGSNTGTRTGETMPFFVTLDMQSAKPTLPQDPARKSWGWLSNSDVLGQVAIDNSGYFAALDALAEGLGDTMIDTNDADWAPVITKRIKYITSKGKTAYRLPANSGEAVTFPAIGWSWDSFVDHRVTRKIGRGT